MHTMSCNFGDALHAERGVVPDEARAAHHLGLDDEYVVVIVAAVGQKKYCELA